MSRRTLNPAAERAAQNAQTIKSLLKLGGNKICADCKRNKHPRWASWNLGVFICIRCSGIHRGMGTHISRVKSVDLDAWTDEQLQSILKWGNLRANKYWESKLASGHVPSESKIENFIRTKYESKRWVLEGPIPDPSTIEVDGDDDIPLSLVKEKHIIDRPASQRTGQSQPVDLSQSKRTIPQPDLLENINSIPLKNSPTSSITKLSSKSVAAPPKQTKPADSLLGLDFFGTMTAPPTRPVSATPMSGTQTRPDLKQSILSLYATAPRPQQQPVLQTQGLFENTKSSISQPAQLNPSGSINDAFSSLSFSGKNTASPMQSGSPAFPDMGNNIPNHNKSNSQNSFQLSGGDFFNNKSAVTSVQHSGQSTHGLGISNEFGTFDSAIESSPTVAKTSSSRHGNLFDFATPSLSATPLQAPAPSVASPVMQQTTSLFNLTQTPPVQPKPVISPLNSNLFTNSDTWGSSDAWASSSNSKSQNQTIVSQTTFDDSGWGNPDGPALEARNKSMHGISGADSILPVVSADEDFGDWGSAATAPTPVPVANASTATSSVTQKSAAGFTGNDDLFSNVWG